MAPRNLGLYEPASRQRIKSAPGHPAVVILGSDKRTTNTLGKCYLCYQESNLKLSHIFPKWIYDSMKADDPDGNGKFRSSIKAMNSELVLQDGERQYMLCESCEQYLGVAENHLKNICSGNLEELAKQGMSVVHNGTEISYLLGANYNLVCRGLLGIAYKVHHSNIHPYTSEKLPAITISKIRAAILADAYSEIDLRILAIKWMSGITSINPRANVYASMEYIKGEKELFGPSFAGITWFISLAGEMIPGVPDKIHFNAGTLPFTLGDIRYNRRVFEEKNYFDEETRISVENNVEYDWFRANSSEPCPCGNSRYSFAECCQSTWGIDADERFITE